MSQQFRTPLFLSLTLFLAACATTQNSGLGGLPSTAQDLDKTLAQAEKRKGTQALALYLSAADLAWQQGDNLKARTLLESLDLSEASVAQQIFAQTLAAELALARQQPAMALQNLAHPAIAHLSEFPVRQQVRTHLVRAKALEATGKNLDAARERIFVAALLDPAQARDNIEQTWHLISQLPSDLQITQSETELAAWFELAQLTRNNTSVGQKQIALQQWLEQNPSHPAAQTMPLTLHRLQAIDSRPYQRIALLLPRNDRNQQVVEAIRNGFLAAYFVSRDQDPTVPELVFIDSDDAGQDPEALYTRLQQQGVDLVVGPWEKPLIARLAQSGRLPLPTLALNYADSGQNSANLYQYGLSAEDEARLVADRAWQEGLRYAATLVQAGDWGQRVQNAFTEHWQQLGGQLAGSIELGQHQDLARNVAELMRLRDSEARSQQLQELLDTRLYSEPARRRDLDFVFLAAPPQQARLVGPTLTLQYAADIPVYATSSINPGQASASTMHDLEGIRFAEIPWITRQPDSLQRDIIQRWPEANGALGRFYAMGADTWKLANQLQLMQALPEIRTPGYTGDLQLNKQNKIERHVDWAHIQDGQLEALR